MRTDDFDYELPPELIAQTPVDPRDSSRLLVYRRETGEIQDQVFRDVIDYFEPGDVLAINDTKVLPARLFGEKKDTGGAVEILLLTRREADLWEILVRPGKKARVGAVIEFTDALSAEIVDILPDGLRLAKFSYEGIFEEILDRLGTMPLPPYIKEKLDDQSRYQTVYARESGSAAAPTAGLHMTPELMERIRAKGVDIVPLTLHVGLGTFRPVAAEEIKDHVMHSEFYEVSKDSADRINAAKRAGKRVIAVGTTSTRVLESVTTEDGVVQAGSGWTNIFIYPGYRYKCVDALVTNFHLPKSTLLMLVSALVGREEMLDIYRHAVQERYRFYSFGDAMLLL